MGHVTYDFDPTAPIPHVFKWRDNMDQYEDAVEWCFDQFGDDPKDYRWIIDYTEFKTAIGVYEAADALLLWMRWKDSE